MTTCTSSPFVLTLANGTAQVFEFITSATRSQGSLGKSFTDCCTQQKIVDLFQRYIQSGINCTNWIKDNTTSNQYSASLSVFGSEGRGGSITFIESLIFTVKSNLSLPESVYNCFSDNSSAVPAFMSNPMGNNAIDAFSGLESCVDTHRYTKIIIPSVVLGSVALVALRFLYNKWENAQHRSETRPLLQPVQHTSHPVTLHPAPPPVNDVEANDMKAVAVNQSEDVDG